MVAIGRALMSQPEILMLDEPSLGLSPVLTKELFRSLARSRDRRRHPAGRAECAAEPENRGARLSDRGRPHHRRRQRAESLMTDPAVINAYLGGGAAARRQSSRSACRHHSRCRAISPRSAGSSALWQRERRRSRPHSARAAAEAPLPSAFAGRYDPASGGDPWADLEKAAPQGQPAPWLRVSGRGQATRRTGSSAGEGRCRTARPPYKDATACRAILLPRHNDSHSQDEGGSSPWSGSRRE